MRTFVRRASLVVAALLLVTYATGALVFSSRCYPNTRAFGRDVSWADVAGVARVLEDHASDWSLRVAGRGLDFVVSADDVGLDVDASRGAVTVMNAQRVWAWPLEAFVAHDLWPDVSPSFDGGRLREAVDAEVGHVNEGLSKPVEARLRRDGRGFSVEPESHGDALDAGAVTARCEEAVCSLHGRVRVGDDCVAVPSVTSGDGRLRASLDRANGLARDGIALTDGGEEVARIDGVTCAGWLSSDAEGGLEVDGAAFRAWFGDGLAGRLDSVGSERSYTGPRGDVVSVSGGTYGWEVDLGKLASAFAEAVRDGSGSVEVPFRSRGARRNPGGADWPVRYVDVDLSEQHVWLMDGGQVVAESDCVSGDPSSGHATPTGVYAVYAHVSPMTLVGADEDGNGEPDYRSDVTYWMPFASGYGLHDAPWRTVFGGQAYRSDGSHGCVNLPSDFARDLYAATDDGTVVVVRE